MDASLETAARASPRPGGPLDAILREAARLLDAPIALFSHHYEEVEQPGGAPQISVPVIAATGEHLGTLSVLGVRAGTTSDPTSLATLHQLATRAAAALQDRR